LATFDDPNYSDEDPASVAKMVGLMAEVRFSCPLMWQFDDVGLQMQSFGSPPAELMGPMPAGFTPGPDGMPKIPEGCVIA